MKEVVRPTQLTNGEHSPYHIFMVDNGGEIIRGAGAPKTPDVQKLQGKQERPIAKTGEGHGPVLSEADRLKQQYIDLSLRIAQAKGEEAINALEELPPRLSNVAAELAKKGIDTGVLDREVKEVLESPRGIGPGTMPPGATDSALDQRLEQLLAETQTPEFRDVVSMASNTPSQMLPNLIEGFFQTYREKTRELNRQRLDLGPVRPENTVQHARINEELDRLGNEFHNISNVIMEAAPRRGAHTEILAEVESIRRMPPDSPQRREEIRKLMRSLAPEDEPLPDEVLKIIGEDSIVTEEFISRLTVSDIEDEPHTMRSFYGQINFEKFLRVTRNIITGERRERLANLIEANKAFHDMNYIIKRAFDRFGEASESLLPRHFEVLSQVPGVDTIIRFYEEAYQRFLSANTRISEIEFQQIDRIVEEELRIANESGAMQGLDGGQLQDWEAFRAKIYGRNFFRIIVRAAEHSVLSELPEKDDPRRYVSPATKGLSQVLNNLKWTGIRFIVEETQGGPELIEEAIRENSSFKGKGRSVGKDKKVRIKTLQGTDIDQREFQGVIGARGVFATWRNAEAVLRKIKFKEPSDGRETNVTQFFLDHINEIKGLKDVSEGERRRRTEELFAPLINNTSIALGILVSPSGLPDVPVELKEILWEKAAELNPLVLASMLTRLEVTDSRDIKTFEDILLEVWGDPEQKTALQGGQLARIKRELEEKRIELDRLTAKKGNKGKIADLRRELDSLRLSYSVREKVLQGLLRDERWQALSKKLLIANELRIRDETERLEQGRFDERSKSLDDYLTERLALNEEERRVLRQITENGKKIAPDLARIRQSYAWFLNDTPFKILQWSNLGQFYDRQTGDLSSFNKGTAAILKIVSNPFGQKEDDILNEFKEGVDGVSGVLGREDAQNRLSPLFRAWLHMIYEKPLLRQKAISGLLHAFRLSTSRAEEIIGPNAPSADEDGIQAILDKSLPLGILRQAAKDKGTGKEKWSNLYGEFMKTFGTEWHKRNILAKIRDWGPFALIALLIYLSNKLIKEKV